jgi:hypothetical protein
MLRLAASGAVELPMVWDQQALLGAEMIAPGGSADALALGVSPRRFSDVLGLD